MNSVRNMCMLMRYTSWANKRLYASLASLSPSLLQDSRPGRPSGLMGTLGHLYAVDLIWKAHLEGQNHDFKSRTLENLPRFDDLWSWQAASDAWYVNFVDMQSEDSLGRVITFNFVDGSGGSMNCGDILLHIVNHKTYHRGYVANMLYESGVLPPTIDLPVFLRDVPLGL